MKVILSRTGTIAGGAWRLSAVSETPTAERGRRKKHPAACFYLLPEEQSRPCVCAPAVQAGVEETPTQHSADSCVTKHSVCWAANREECLLATFSTELGLSRIYDTEYHRADHRLTGILFSGERGTFVWGKWVGRGHLCVPS